MQMLRHSVICVSAGSISAACGWGAPCVGPHCGGVLPLPVCLLVLLPCYQVGCCLCLLLNQGSLLSLNGLSYHHPYGMLGDIQIQV